MRFSVIVAAFVWKSECMWVWNERFCVCVCVESPRPPPSPLSLLYWGSCKKSDKSLFKKKKYKRDSVGADIAGYKRSAVQTVTYKHHALFLTLIAVYVTSNPHTSFTSDPKSLTCSSVLDFLLNGASGSSLKLRSLFSTCTGAGFYFYIKAISGCETDTHWFYIFAHCSVSSPVAYKPKSKKGRRRKLCRVGRCDEIRGIVEPWYARRTVNMARALSVE